MSGDSWPPRFNYSSRAGQVGDEGALGFLRWKLDLQEGGDGGLMVILNKFTCDGWVCVRVETSSVSVPLPSERNSWVSFDGGEGLVLGKVAVCDFGSVG